MNGKKNISVIIPVLGEEASLESLLQQLCETPHIESTVVVDAGEDPNTKEMTDRYGALYVRAPCGRGLQMNRGAEKARGEILWFLHADNSLFPDSTEAILSALEDPNCVGGVFSFCLSEPRWYAPLFRWSIGLRSRMLGLPFGDQGLFVRTKVFRRLEGFQQWPILEDVDFVWRLKKQGRIEVLPLCIGVSPRRWDREGVFRRTFLNWVILLAFFLGVSPHSLAFLYPSEKGR